MAIRPKALIGILGTHTEVGKTYVATRWLAHLREQGLNVAARKPVQSFSPDEPLSDAQRLAEVTGERASLVCAAHRSYPCALAPPMAADALSRPRIFLCDLISELTWPEGLDVGLIETVGGPRSPIAHDGDSIDLVNALNVDAAVLIADSGLGTLNATRLSLAATGERKTVVFLNRYDAADELHRLNRQWLHREWGIDAAVEAEGLTPLLGQFLANQGT